MIVADELSDDERTMLDIEHQWWRHSGRKEAAVRDRLGMSMEQFHLLLFRLIETERALAHDPLTVKRLQRLVRSKQRTRSARRLGIDL